MTGSRLVLARKMRGLTQTQLARSASVSAKAISKFEKEGTGLGEETLEKIARILRFDLSFFYRGEVELPETGSVSFRARSKMTAKKRDQALAISYFGLELSDWMDRNYYLPATNVPCLEELDAEAAAIALRSYWGVGESPIADMISLLENYGIRVFSVSEASREIDAYSFWDEARNKAFIFLTTSKSGERRRMDAAHELGHLVLHRKVTVDSKKVRDLEKEANTFAAAFLMPKRSFLSSLHKGCSFNDIMKKKKYWKVSAFAMVYRAHELGILSDWQYHSMCKMMSKQGMRINESDGIWPERSQIADKIFALEKEKSGTIDAISEETKIPLEIVLQLTFSPTFSSIRGGLS